MDLQNPVCDRRTIEQFLADQLGADEQAAFESHLETCPACREKLESLAADRSWWNDARAFLSSHDPVLREPATSDWPADADAEAAAEEHDPAALFGLTGHLAPTDDPRMLGRIGTYEIAGIIGSGGMGVVLKGFDPALNRYVAIKVLAPRLAASGAARKRFAREAQAAAAVVHENVMAIHSVSEIGGLPYFVMPYARGTSLEKRLGDSGPLAVEEILRIGFQAAAGLAAAHAQGLVHRDIKPANILLEDGVERVKLTDFGLARAADDASLTRSGVIAGTPQYMSPEQARGEAVDHRTDLFSLGSVLYAMCTARPPFRAETAYGVLRRIGETDPRPIGEINPSVPGWLCRIVGRLHEKDPARRYASAGEVAQLLERCLAHLQQPSSVALPEGLTEKATVRRRWTGWHVAAAAAVLIALGTTAAGIWLAGRGNEPRRNDEHASRGGAAANETAARRGAPRDSFRDYLDDSLVELADDVAGAEANWLGSDWDDGAASRLEQLEADVSRMEAEAAEPP